MFAEARISFYGCNVLLDVLPHFKLHKTALCNYFSQKAVDISCFPLIMAQSYTESVLCF